MEPGPKERIGWGSIGFEIKFDNMVIVNLGDTLLLNGNEWQKIKSPDVLMIPIGGKAAHNTMDEKEALQAIKTMKPKLVIPCHYNSPSFFNKNLNPADDKMFKKEVEKMGIECNIMSYGDEILV